MNRAYYSDLIGNFCKASPDDILGRMSGHNEFDLTLLQRDVWREQARLLQKILPPFHGKIYLEFNIPRMGKRIDAVLVIGPIVFVLEFKVNEVSYQSPDVDQVVDYALDMRNFHEGSHNAFVVPILVATDASYSTELPRSLPSDKLFSPILTNRSGLTNALQRVLKLVKSESIPVEEWETSGYKPTPTIIEATLALYRGHSVSDISRNDAGAMNLTSTSATIDAIITKTRLRSEKAICFVTGVPGAGKTLVGLNAATKHFSKKDELYSVFLSGNGPLVKILQEALARDKIDKARQKGKKMRKGEAHNQVKAFIQNVHHFRDEGLRNPKPPAEHVAIFDEAQRAWTLKMTSNFMTRKKGIPGFNQSEPEFLISCLDRHPDWATVVCLVGGGQEINTGEAGIGEWLDSLERSFPHWKIYVSDRLIDSEYGAGEIVDSLRSKNNVVFKSDLHLATSMRSFRSENVSLMVKQLLDLELENAALTLNHISAAYPIVLTRELHKARQWLRQKARGTERFGFIASSAAERLRPLALDVKREIDPVHWFLNPKDDVRSAYYLEDVATEFHVQGLELDWAGVVWDGDFRYSTSGWNHWSFKGNRWQRMRLDERQKYLKNAYRVLLTRARQGMAIVVPEGDAEDPTRNPSYYDDTFSYLKRIGFQTL